MHQLQHLSSPRPPSLPRGFVSACGLQALTTSSTPTRTQCLAREYHSHCGWGCVPCCIVLVLAVGRRRTSAGPLGEPNGSHAVGNADRTNDAALRGLDRFRSLTASTQRGSIPATQSVICPVVRFP